LFDLWFSLAFSAGLSTKGIWNASAQKSQFFPQKVHCHYLLQAIKIRHDNTTHSAPRRRMPSCHPRLGADGFGAAARLVQPAATGDQRGGGRQGSIFSVAGNWNTGKRR